MKKEGLSLDVDSAAAAQDFFASQICQTVLQYITGNIIMLLFFKPGKTM
jgi:hypothetical protein